MAETERTRVPHPLYDEFAMRCLRQRLSDCNDAVAATLQGLDHARMCIDGEDGRLDPVHQRLRVAQEAIAAARSEVAAQGGFSG